MESNPLARVEMEAFMKPHHCEATRRDFIKLTVTGLAAATLASGASAEAQMLSEEDPTAKALKYVADATKATARTDQAATCANCLQFKGVPGAADGPCGLFPGKSVSAGGWCSAWAKKA
jgi:hypothetical protein